jgi:hypothetical protein
MIEREPEARKEGSLLLGLTLEEWTLIFSRLSSETMLRRMEDSASCEHDMPVVTDTQNLADR